ncbi:MAG: DUF1987 domain-containing protein [Flavobacteriales bacterium]|nr:DUF1987 domain-containing protein [Flavobacteriales bacterium]
MIEKLQIDETFKTPSIQFDPDIGTLEIEGRSILDIPRDFYTRILDWLDKYRPKKGLEISVRIQFYYYSTPSVKYIREIFKKMEALHQRGHKIEIKWECEEGDDDTLRDGEGFKVLVNLPFEIVIV